MIVVDIETSGGPALNKYGIWQIGAINMETGEEFLEEARIDDEDKIVSEALEVTGKKENELRDKSKQSQKQMIEKFLKWLENAKIKNLACLHPQFDIAFLWLKMEKYGLKSKCFGFPDYQRVWDLHTLAQLIYYKKNKKFLIKEDHSDMGLRNILGMLGVKDERRRNIDGKITEGKPHNALEDAKLEAFCFKKLLGGEN
jgi:DNA polymerase III epsilon subunit-like protein